MYWTIRLLLQYVIQRCTVYDVTAAGGTPKSYVVLPLIAVRCIWQIHTDIEFLILMQLVHIDTTEI